MNRFLKKRIKCFRKCWQTVVCITRIKETSRMLEGAVNKGWTSEEEQKEEEGRGAKRGILYLVPCTGVT